MPKDTNAITIKNKNNYWPFICTRTDMEKQSISPIAILGAGNLGQAIARGLLDKGGLDSSQLTLTRHRVGLLSRFAEDGVKILTNNRDACNGAKFIILGVKPYKVAEVVKEIAPILEPGQIIISMATGITIEDIQDWSEHKVTVIRSMPNTAAGIGECLTCISRNGATDTEVAPVLQLFEKIGRVVEIPEELMNASTVLGACGIAYALRFIRAMVQGGIEIGFDAATASLIANQTVRGAATLLLEGNLHPEQEIDKVTTPMGCTIAGLNQMEHQGFSSSLIKGITTSYDKISK
jgi:pyrroline-5-carboxylate reductase